MIGKTTSENSNDKKPSERESMDDLPNVLAEMVLVFMVPTGKADAEIEQVSEDELADDVEMLSKMRMVIARSDLVEKAMCEMYVAAINFIEKYPEAKAYFSPHWKLEEPWEIKPNG